MKVKSESEVAQSCLTLGDPMDCSLPGSSVHGIFQARIREWGAIFWIRVKVNWKKARESGRREEGWPVKNSNALSREWVPEKEALSQCSADPFEHPGAMLGCRVGGVMRGGWGWACQGSTEVEIEHRLCPELAQGFSLQMCEFHFHLFIYLLEFKFCEIKCFVYFVHCRIPSMLRRVSATW